MKENVGRILLFGSTDDPFLPWSEQNEVSLCVTNSRERVPYMFKALTQIYMTSTIMKNLDALLNNYEDRG